MRMTRVRRTKRKRQAPVLCDVSVRLKRRRAQDWEEWYRRRAVSFDAMLTETMDVYRPSWSTGENAGMIRDGSLPAIAEGVPCRDMTSSATDQLLNRALGVTIDHRIITNYGGLLHDDLIVVTGTSAGETTEVVMRIKGTPTRRRAIGGMPGFFCADAEEITL